MLLARLVYYFYRALMFSWRIDITEHPSVTKLIQNHAPVILAHWHGDELALIHLVHRYKLATMTSLSKDGSLINYVIHRLGGATARGSSSRGAVSGLRGLIRLCRSGRMTSLAVDGPRGPYHIVKPGIFELSKACGAHVVPVGVVAPKSFVFRKSWNRAFLPLPFSKIKIYLGEPILPLKNTEDPRDTTSAVLLAEKLVDSGQQAGKFIAGL